MANRRLPWTHFYIRSDNKITGFTLDECENCGGEIQAANSVTLAEPVEKLRALGLVELSHLPPEGYYSETFGGEACYGCNG